MRDLVSTKLEYQYSDQEPIETSEKNWWLKTKLNLARRDRLHKQVFGVARYAHHHGQDKKIHLVSPTYIDHIAF